MSERQLGDPGPNEQHLNEPYLDGEFLEGLFRVLTAAPSRSELAGGPAAMAAFRAVQEKRAAQAGAAAQPGSAQAGQAYAGQGPGQLGQERAGRTAESGGPDPAVGRTPADQQPAWLGSTGSRPPAAAGRPKHLRAGWRLRLGVVAGAAVPFALLIGAAYAQALPAPVQRAAHQILGFAGVPSPGSHPPGPAGASALPGSHAGPSRSDSPAGPSPSSGQPGPGATKPTPGSSTPSAPAISLAISAQDVQVGADAPAVLSVRVSSGGRPASRIQVSLQERPAGQAGWSAAGTAVSSPTGAAIVQTGPLTRNTEFRFTDARGDVSAPVTVTVVLPVTLNLIHAHGKNHFAASVSAPLAATGDRVIVQAMINGAWQNVSTRQVGQNGAPVIVRMSPRFAGAQVRALLPATAAHAASVSNLATIPHA